MYSSSQRQWIDNQGEKVAGYPFESYKDYLSKNMERAKALSCVKKYLKKHDIHYNEMWLLALMQHYDAPSTIISEEAKKHIHCWNVHKRLIPMIKWRYLYPRMKVNYFIYRKWCAEDRELEREMKCAFY